MCKLDLPDSVKYSYEPYTYDAVLVDLSEGDYNGHPTVTGTVEKGTETAYLYTESATRDITGKVVTIYGVQQWELDRGHIRRVAS